MDKFFFLLTFISIVAFLIGLFSPEKSLFWWGGERTRMLSAKVYATSFGVCFLIFIWYMPKNQTIIEKTARTAPDTTNKQTAKEIKDSLQKQAIVDSLYKISQEKIQKLLAEDTQSKSSQNQMEYIPRLTAVDVYLNLTNKGFSKTLGNYGGGLEYFCEQKTPEHSLDVQIIGEADDKIERIRATATYHSGNDYEDAKNFLAFVAGVTYKGARPQEASNWVRANVGQRVSTTIGGVTFSLAGEGNSVFTKMLTIEPAP